MHRPERQTGIKILSNAQKAEYYACSALSLAYHWHWVTMSKDHQHADASLASRHNENYDDSGLRARSATTFVAPPQATSYARPAPFKLLSFIRKVRSNGPLRPSVARQASAFVVSGASWGQRGERASWSRERVQGVEAGVQEKAQVSGQRGSAPGSKVTVLGRAMDARVDVGLSAETLEKLQLGTLDDEELARALSAHNSLVMDAGAAAKSDTLKQAKLYQEFRGMVDSLPNLTEDEKKWLDFYCLHRYLRARKWDLEKSLEMIKGTLEWRKTFDVVGLMKGDLTEIEKESATGKMYVGEKDKQGRPILYMKPRYQNTKGQVAQIRHLVYTLERCVAEMEPPVEKLALLIDFQGFSIMNSPSLSQQKETLSILQDHYPERLGLALCYDAPGLFWAAYKVIKPFIDPVTAEKIEFCTRKMKPTSKEYQFIEKHVGWQTLEAEYGGQLKTEYSNEAYFRTRILPRYLL
ncbi:CRAL-TRIO domain-containing protein [Porphyridium purpureum]|uniref:CRAL-TRIO domain-containing protein n=1 Tax=Porphyridium purpureum TaxID=35688 RepID=A0A5J4YP55_PORPP|nr:CRAL-TRIO domain-containing protein [Porphyridium purpureum]|eukprot:POR0824..scf295_9